MSLTKKNTIKRKSKKAPEKKTVIVTKASISSKDAFFTKKTAAVNALLAHAKLME